MSSIVRSVKVMELLARKSPMGVRAIAQSLVLPLGSVHRLLLDLEREHAVERNGDGEWELSYRLFEITGIFLKRLDFPTLIRPFAEAIAEKAGETVNINLFRGMSAVCIDKCRGNEAMQLDWPIGSRGPLHCGGAGKALLAYLPEAEQERAIAGPLKSYTAHTFVDPDLLRAEIARTRTRGYSIDNQELVLGIYCVAVPILNQVSRPVGAISITGTSVKAPGASIEPLIEMLNEAAGHVSRRVGFTGPWPHLPGAPDADGANGNPHKGDVRP